MTTHPTCDESGANADRGSREGRLSEDTIRFSSITRDRMEIETRKWCQTRQAALEDMHIDPLWSWPDVDLTYP